MRYEITRHEDGSLTATATPETHFDRVELDEHPWIPGIAFSEDRVEHWCGRCCDGCKVELTGHHQHLDWCPHNWPSVHPSEWTAEQRERARPGR